MNHSEIAALMKGVAPVIRDLVKAHVAPLERRIAELQEELQAERQRDLSGDLARLVAEAVAALPPAQPGKDADMQVVAKMVSDAVSEAAVDAAASVASEESIRALVQQAVDAVGPPAALVESIEAAKAAVVEARQALHELPARVDAAIEAIPPAPVLPDLDAMVKAAVSEAVEALPPAKDGASITPEQVEPMLAKMVQDAVAALPAPENGTSVTVEDVAPLITEEVRKAVAAIPPAEPGEPGAPGKLPLAKAWDGEVTYEAEVRTHKGALWQAARDTGREPGGDDWICLAVAGVPGKDADQIEVAGTYDPGKANSYRRLNVVALNGGAFIARQDAPGECPGEGWQVIAMRGKAGPPGQSIKGDPGVGRKGDPGDPVLAMSVDDQGLLTLVNGDGSTVECDLYPLLSKIGG